MKGIIIAAGGGSRLLPLTATTPKCLVSVGGRPILDHQLDALAAAGIDEVAIVGGYRMDRIAEHLAAADRRGRIDLVFNPFWSVASSIGSVWCARGHLADPFVLMNGDTVFDPSILAAVTGDARVGVALAVERLGAPETDDMLVRVSDGRVVDVAKTLDPATATHRSLGVVVSGGGAAYVDALDAVIGGDGGPFAYHHAVVARLAAEQPVAALEVEGSARWQEIDRPEDIGRWEGG